MSQHSLALMTNGEAAQARLLAALACPDTGGALDVEALETAGRAIRRGAIFNRDSGARVGKIENFQVDFVRPGDGDSREALQARARAGEIPLRTDTVAQWRLTPHSAEAIAYSAPTIKLNAYEMIAVDQPGSTISFEASGEVELVLFAHSWSGMVELRYLDALTTIDLYAPHTVIPHPVRIDLGAAPTQVEIRITGAKSDLSFGRQCLFGGYRVKTGQFAPLRHNKEAKVRGASFTAAFHRLLADTPDDGVLLDLGGGNRQVDDARYINADYADYAEPDLIADATKLPFRDNSVDAVYSTGVFEHINDPQRAGAEVARVLKPGGRALIGWAFMQPIHSEGQHFYNATPWGVERAFAALKPKGFWYDTSFAFLVRWGANVSGLRGLVPDEEIEQVCATLARWDTLIPATHKSYMANGVWGEFEKA
ncbi:MAG: class I SAM-dependent methyltransferase [Pseudomonadota bacterium]|nr:class I SAM-dependent methyltransferase [Pseudomonadota bacterium]